MTKPMGRSVVAAPAEKEEKEPDAKPAVSVRTMSSDMSEDAQCCLKSVECIQRYSKPVGDLTGFLSMDGF